MAFDLGTTTVVATLLDLNTGTPVAVASMLNMQQPFGADVITRISATMLDPDALGRLRDRAPGTLAQLALEVCEKGEIAPEAVYEVAVAGNAAIRSSCSAWTPSRSASRRSSWRRARSRPCAHRDLGLALHPRATACLFPALGAYVGGDIVAGVLATGMTRDRRLRLLHRRRHELRDRARQRGARRDDAAAPAGPGVRGRADRVRHPAPPKGRSRPSRSMPASSSSE